MTSIAIKHFHDIEELPACAQPLQLFSTNEAVNVLLSSELSNSQICGRVPFGVEVNPVFVVDLNKLFPPNYVLCDDMGV